MKNSGWLKYFIPAVAFLFPVILRSKRHLQKGKPQRNNPFQLIIPLPAPVHKSSISIEEALLKRRSIRDFNKEPLTLTEIAQLLWAAQGVTSTEDSDGVRTAPSAGALYPMELYVVSGNINSIPPGVYHYSPSEHILEQISKGDKRKLLMGVALMQGVINRSAAIIVIAGEYRRTIRKYFERGKKYVHLEAGHIAQNIYLQAVSLNVGTVAIGAFSDSLVKQLLRLPQNETPFYLMPIGKI